MRIIILGGTGFLGSHLASRLSVSGHEVVAVGRRAMSGRRYQSITCDLFDAPDLVSLLREADVCMHLANDLVPSTAERAGHVGIVRNMDLAASIVSACRSNGVAKLVFASSGGTLYGNDAIRASEESSCRPIGMYGVQKLTIESLLRAGLHGSETALMNLRIGNPYGPGQERQTAQGVIGHLLAAMISGKDFTVWGDGSQMRDYVYIEDVMDAFEASLSSPGHVDTVNIGTGIGTTTNELIEICRGITGKDINVIYGEHPNYDVDRVSLDARRAEVSLGWYPKTTLVDGISLYFEAIQENI